MKSLFLLLAIAIPFSGFTQSKKSNPNKDAVVKSVDTHQQELIKISDAIWGYAETALREIKSSKELADYAEKQGFKVTRGVAQMPTAFIAEYGSGKPIIGIMGE
jgi:aminobenzoyl-glutamate utilization protein B